MKSVNKLNISFLIVLLYPFLMAQILPAQPKIIFDTDFGGDAGDLGALAMLNGFHQSGEAELLGVMVWNQEKNSVAGVDAVNRYYGNIEIPIGLREGPSSKFDWNFSRSIIRILPSKKANSNVPGAVELYRKILSESEDKSISWLQLGRWQIFRICCDPALIIIPNLMEMPCFKKKLKRWL